MKSTRVLKRALRSDGAVYKIAIYSILIGISFIYLYPILRMLAMSLMTLEDLNDVQRNWLPSSFYLSNYVKAFKSLNYMDALKDSLIVSVLPSLVSLVSSSLVGYGLGIYNFKGKKVILGILVALFVVPTVLTSLPTFILYRTIGILDSITGYLVPAIFGFGIRQSLFILIFYQFFRQIPKELLEAAEIDGASQFRIFIQVAIPLTVTAFLICFLYSFVWYFNETTLVTLYFPTKYRPLARAINTFDQTYRKMFTTGTGIGAEAEQYNEGILFAGTLLSIAPLLLVYAVAQKWFIEGIDKSGIAGQ